MSLLNIRFGTWLRSQPFHYFRFATLFIACYILASCSLTPKQPPHFTHPDWEISGKIGIKESTLRASSSFFQWKQQDEHYIIYLINAIGQTQFTLSGSDHQASIQKANGETATADTPEELLEQVTGWHFPVSAVRHWMQGKTQGSEKNIIRTDEGHLYTFNTENWQATLEQYKPVAQQMLPHKIKLQQNDLKITLIIKQHAHFTP